MITTSVRDVTADDDQILDADANRDGPLAHDCALAAGALSSIVCADLPELVERLTHSAGAVLLAEEALVPARVPLLLEALQAQPPWSDVPLVIP